MRTKLFAGVAFAALIVPGAAYAQSTGTVDAENQEIVVTARNERGVGGVQVPDTTKAKGVLGSTFIQRSTPGNSILERINQLPGVSFQNNDPFGSSGGTLNIRGFDASRISLTFDGIPLNDTGNYAIFSNQQLDPELIENVNVNFGSTDIDSPSASASGSTVNYRTRNPTDEFGARLLGSVGNYQFFRIFGVVDTGVFTPFGTKAWLSASHAENNLFQNNYGVIDKQQYNGKLYQPIGSNGDFISLSGNYNQNRNNSGGSAPLRNDDNIFSQTTTAPGSITNPTLVTGAVRVPGTAASNRFPRNRDELPYVVARCTLGAVSPGVAGTPALVVAPGASNNGTGCGTSFDERFNPSNTGSVRLNSRFTLADNLILTIDPSFQYTKANGGGTVTARENLRDVNPAGIAGGPANVANCTTVTTGVGVDCQAGYFGGIPYAGIDLNGDGDALDGVNILAPSQTKTRRYGVIAGLRYDLSDEQTVRLNYTFDRGRHRQTGETGFLQANGMPRDVFPVNDPIVASNGIVLQKRDRLSYATLNQVSFEYRGQFFDDKLVVNAGVSGKFFRRKLDQRCFTSSASGFVECGGSDAVNAVLALRNPLVFNATTGATTSGFVPPQVRNFKYNRALPSAGFTFRAMENVSFFGNYSKGIQVPSTDNLYNSFYFQQGTDAARPTPETTDNFDIGARYTSSTLQASINPWYTRFQNRLSTAFDADTQQSIFTNLGKVERYGIDGQIDYRPIREILVHVFGSYLKSKIKDDVQLGNCPATLTTANTTVNCTVAGAPIFAATAGRRESGSPVYTFGGRLQGSFGPLDLGVEAKRTGRRYLNDQNQPLIQCTSTLINQICPSVANTPTTFTGTRGFQYQVFDAATKAYTTVDLDARLSMAWAGLNDKTYLQLNLQNAFNKFYVGGLTGTGAGQVVTTTVPFVQIGSPRAFIASLNVAF